MTYSELINIVHRLDDMKDENAEYQVLFGIATSALRSIAYDDRGLEDSSEIMIDILKLRLERL